MNHAHYDERLEFVRSTLKDEFDLHPQAITPIAYEQGCPFPYNNFIYKIQLDESQHQQFPSRRNQPGTETIPNGTQQLVIRLANAAAKLNDQNRVQNEVAALSLARSALGPERQRIVPAVYGWGSAAEGQGWILMEFMSGVPLDEYVAGLTGDDDDDDDNQKQKREIISQVASVLEAFQKVQLPLTVRGFGGLSFDEQGSIVSGSLTTSKCGPFDTFPAMVKAILHEKLLQSDSSSVVNGWRINGLRSRLEKYITDDIEHVLGQFRNVEKRFIHGDFTLNNMLIDPHHRRITAIIDFDWSYISFVADECLLSFDARYARLPGPLDSDADRIKLRAALLHGFPSGRPSDSKESVDWDLARIWDEQLEQHGVLRARTIGEDVIEKLSWLYAFGDALCPGTLFEEVIVRQRAKENLEKEMVETAEMLSRYLQGPSSPAPAPSASN